MSTSAKTTSRSLLEVALGFLGAMLIVPLLYRTIAGLVRGIFRFSTTRRIVGEVALAGFMALLTNPGVLDLLFGRKGTSGAGLFKTDARGEAD